MAHRIIVRPAELSDVPELVANLIPEDRVEILAMGFDPEWGIRNSIQTSVETAAFCTPDGKLGCIIGLSRMHDLADEVQPWLVSTPEIYNYQKEFVRASRLVLRHWQKTYPKMSNYVDARHSKATTWLKWLGAKLEPAAPHGPYGRSFHKFTFGVS